MAFTIADLGLPAGLTGWMWADSDPAILATSRWPSGGQGAIIDSSATAIPGAQRWLEYLGFTIIAESTVASQVVRVRSFAGDVDFFTYTIPVTTAVVGDFVPVQSAGLGAGLVQGIAPTADGGNAFSGPGVLLPGFSFQVTAGGSNTLKVRFWFKLAL